MFKIFYVSTPICVEGYFPLYIDKKSSDNASSLKSSHTHVLNGIKYYMPNGGELGKDFYHGTYKRKV